MEEVQNLKVITKAKPSVNNDIYEAYGHRWYTADDDPVALLRAESKTKTPWVLQKIEEHFPLRPTTRVLDVGCGAGFLSNEMAKTGLSVTGVDISSESLRVAHEHDETGRVEYKTADAYRLPFADNEFAVITAMDFLEHVDDPQRVIQEISRVLKPSGIFIFHTFNRNPLSHVVIIKFVEWFVKNTPKNMHVIDLFIKPEELKHYCAKAGMSTIEMVGIKPIFTSIPFENIWTGVVPKTLRFELTKSLMLSYMGYAIKENRQLNSSF